MLCTHWIGQPPHVELETRVCAVRMLPFCRREGVLLERVEEVECMEFFGI